MFTIEVNEKVRELLDRNRIFTQPGGGVRGQKWKISADVAIERYTSFFGGDTFATMGSFSYATGNMPPLLKVGRYCSIGSSVAVLGFSHPTTWATTSNATYERSGPAIRAFENDNQGSVFPRLDVGSFQKGRVNVGNDVWIGWRSTLAQGISIGDGAIIAANSHVVKDVEPYTIVGGNPARVIRSRFSDELVERFIASRWWRYSPADLPLADAPSPESFLDQVEALAVHAEPFTPGFVTAEMLTEAAGAL